LRADADSGGARRGALQAWVRALDAVKIVGQVPGVTLPSLFDDVAAANPGRVALIGEREELTYQALAALSGRYADWAIAEGLAPGSVIALLMRNCPSYVAIWCGLTKAGCIVALLNTNLVGAGLAHCVDAARPARLIVSADLLENLAGALPHLVAPVACWVHGETPDPRFPRIDGIGVPPAVARGRRAVAGRALLIYTSGTTGLPKAANVSHDKLVEWSLWFAGMMDVQPQDRLYDCLPMYHSTGGVVAIGAMLLRGASVLIRERFSLARFWDDVADGDCTIFQYIGELCRYLMNAPPHRRERQHRLRLCCGNGLRADVWESFQRRFAIPHILEFYAATEGSVSLYNAEEKPGAIGRVPPFLAHRFPIALIRCDPETGNPLRNADGFCIACEPDEAGEAIGPIGTGDTAPGRRFDGYTDAAASDRKRLRDVFAKGDCWFRTGDLMRRDRAGFYYFEDRIGDTFRWKGENVSATEVATVIAACPGVTEAIVYGVEVPGHEGRAGMAALTTGPSFGLAGLHVHLAANLPEYARPLFIRLCASIATTGTFKPVKAHLAREGYSAAAAPDPVWFRDRAVECFVPCDEPLRAALARGLRRL
jgi:fatty-acyl-CoA synthase